MRQIVIIAISQFLRIMEYLIYVCDTYLCIETNCRKDYYAECTRNKAIILTKQGHIFHTAKASLTLYPMKKAS